MMGIVVRGDNSKGRLRFAKRLTCLALAVFICITTAVTPYAQALPEETSAPAVTVVSTELPESYDIMQTVPTETEAPTPSVPDVTDSPAVTSAPETSGDIPSVTDAPAVTDQPSSDVAGITDTTDTPAVTDTPDTGSDIMDTGDVTDSSDVTDPSDTGDTTDDSGDETSDISDILDELDPNDSFVDEDGVMFFTLTRGSNGSVTWKVGVNASGYYTLLVEGNGEVPSDILDSEDVAPYKNLITRVQINSGVTSIGENAFRELRYLTEVRFAADNTVESIGNGAFAECPLLRIINLEDCHYLTSIGDTAKVETASEDDNIGASSIRSTGAFYDSGLTSINIPSSLKSLGHGTFANCESLTDVHFETNYNIFTFGADVFAFCKSLENINLEALGSGVITNKIEKYSKYKQGLFHDCDSLESITIPGGFGYNGSQLYSMFSECDGLTSINFLENHNITGINNQIDNIIAGSTRNIAILDLRNLVDLKEIGAYAIRGQRLSIVYLPKNLMTLGNQPFGDCDSLTAVVFPEGSELTTVGSSSFNNNDNLVSVNLENTKVKTIGSYAFQNDPALSEITFPETLTKVEYQAFQKCIALSEIYYNATNLEDFNSDAFQEANTKINIHVGTSVQYINKSFLQAINGHVGDFTFEPNCSFTVNDNSDYDTPFKVCGHYETDENGNLYRVDGAIKILVLASKDSTGTFTVPADVTRIASYAFKGRSGIAAINFQDISKIEELDEYAFADCYGLENLTAGELTKEEVKTALEAKCTNPDTLFVNTKVSGSTSGDDIVGTKQTGRYTFGELDISVDEGKYSGTLLTGEIWKVNVGISNAESNHKYRIYVKHEDGCSLPPIYDAKVVTGPHHTENPNIDFYQINDDLSVGAAGTKSFPISYPNETAPGKKVQVWAVQGDVNTFPTTDDKKVIYPSSGTVEGITADSQYLEMEWTTNPIPHEVVKSSSATPSFAVKHSQPTLTNLHYNINITYTGKADVSHGTDNSIAAEYRDVITLPEHLTWVAGLQQAIASGKYNYTIRSEGSNRFATLYATIGGAEYEVFSISLTEASNCTLSGLRLEWQEAPDGTNAAPVLIWQVRSTDNKSQLPPLKASLNIGDVIVGDTTFAATADNATFTIKNNVDTRVTHQFSPDDTSSSGCDVTVSKRPADISLAKEMLNAPEYLGEDVKYRITIENDTTNNTTAGALTKDNADLILHDGLYLKNAAASAYKVQYIKPENIVELFEDNAAGRSFKLEISDAVLTAMNIDGNTTVPTVDGEEMVTLTPSNTAKVTNNYSVAFEAGTPEEQQYDDRHECSDDANVITKNAVITIEKVDGVLQVTVDKKDGADVSEENLALNGTALKELFDRIGFIVTPSTKYDLYWTYPADHEFEAGKSEIIEYTATTKNTFMYTPQDKHYYYNYEGTTVKAKASNFVEIANPVDPDHPKTSEVPEKEIERDLEIYKGYAVNGEDRTGSLEFNIANGDLIDYSLLIDHSGSSTYDVLPCVDSMVGPQVLLVEAAKNPHLAAENLPTYTVTDENGVAVEYYILKKVPGETKVYNNVWIGGFCAESVTVSEPDGGEIKGCKTIIKWYFKDTLPRDFTMSINCKALVSVYYSGAPELPADTIYKTYEMDNTVWLNDHAEHRIYDYIGTPVSVTDFKKIAIERSGILLGEEEQTSCPVGVGNTIKYQLAFTIKGNATDELTGKNIYDLLPYTGDVFAWTKGSDSVKPNVEISYGSNGKKHPKNNTDLVTIEYNGKNLLSGTTGEEWEIVTEVDKNNTNRYKIKWADNFAIKFANPENDFDITNERTAYIYVTLTFPDNTNSTWDKYVNATTNAAIVNTLSCNKLESNVTHNLSGTCSAFIQKGVYETGSFSVRGDNSEKKSYYRGEDRLHYATTSAGRKRVVENYVTYYVVIANTGNTKLYLAPIYDILPEGFEFFSLCSATYYFKENCTDFVGNKNDRHDAQCCWGGTNSDCIPNMLIPSVEKAEMYLNNHTVKHDTTYTRKIGNRQVIKLDVENGYWQEEHVKKDDIGKYLEPNHYIQFGITCKTPSTRVENAENLVVMEYLDYTHSLLDPDKETKIVVNDHNNLVPNDGERYVLDDSELTKLLDDNQLEHVQPGGKIQWLASSVTVKPGEIEPGIDKTVVEPLYKIENGKIKHESESTIDGATDNVVWTVTSHNTGTEGITNYKIVDTLDYPLRFEGDFRYQVEFDADPVYPYGDMEGTKWVLMGNAYNNNKNLIPMDRDHRWINLFTIERNENDDSMKIWSNRLTGSGDRDSSKSITLQPNTSGDLNVLVMYRSEGHIEDKVINIEFKLTDVTDSDGNTYKQETLIVTFADDVFTIVPNGKAIFDVSSKINPKVPTEDKISTFNNNAYLVPITQTYDKTAGVGQDTVYNGSKAVRAVSQISTYADSPTSSVKKIEEVDNESNCGYSNKPLNNKILVDSADKKVRYTLSVTNGDDAAPMKQLVIIDNLPEPGDTMTLSSKTRRNSDFKVSLDDIPNFVVKVTPKNSDGTLGPTETLSPTTDYTIDFRKDANFDRTRFDSSPDWKGLNPSAWNAAEAEARSFRVVINKQIEAGATVDISFNAKLDQNAKPGQIAWNSFGYCFETTVGGETSTKWLYAAPKEVGVGLPELPDIQKRRVVMQDGIPVDYKPAEAETFTFIICKENYDRLPDLSDAKSLDEIKTALNGKAFAEFTLEVAANNAYSDKLSPENIINLPTGWTWDIGTEYTIIEVPNDNYLSQPVISYFVYEKGSHDDVIIQNIRKKSIEITKVDRTDTTKPLRDAVFGLYSPDAADEMSQAAIEAFKTANSLPDLDLSSVMTIEKNGKTYYLYRIVATDENGKIIFDKLSQEDYLIKELKAPEGYYLIPAQSEQVVDLKNIPDGKATLTLEIKNRKKALFPHTGGHGRSSTVLPGALLALFGACAYALILRRRIRSRKV